MAAVSVPATAQTSRPTAMTCDRYKKDLSLAITKRRRIDADARAELNQQADAPNQGYGVEEAPAGPPPRDYAEVDSHRRKAAMACAQHKFEEGINEYTKAFNLIGEPPPRY